MVTKIVYVLVAYYDASTELVGVFSSKSLAEARAFALEKANGVDIGAWGIYETVIDSNADPKYL